MKVCIDIGGTKVAVTLASGSHLISETRRTEPTATKGGRDALAVQLTRMVTEACAAYENTALTSISALGVSSCGPFVIQEGLVELAAPNICGGIAGPARRLPNDWPSALLELPLQKHFPTAKVTVANDCIAALEAERRWGALQGYNHCAYVTWSTGIGIGLCVDGHVLRGKNGNAGHAGHMFVGNDDSHALCGCGNLGDVEGLVAGNALARRFSDQGYADAAALLLAAKSGDARASDIMDIQCRTMGRMLYNLVVTLDLQRISLGGSVFWNNRDWLLPRLQAHISPNPMALTTGFSLVEAGLGEKLGDYAALALVS